jgi:acetate---CoA ligase (ADP-forming)
MSRKTIFKEIDPIFHPRSVALIGASGKHGKIGRVLMDRFLETGFERLYPVNPRETEILGLKTYPSIRDIPYEVDMALVVTPTQAALTAVREAVKKKVQTVVITTSGFGETGSKGKEVQNEMVRVAREGGARIVGPNCIGIYCPASRLPFALGPGKTPGSIGVVSQSGFFADYLTYTATANGINFSKAVSCGNEADLTVTDFLEYLGEDPETETIVVYVEGMRDGRRFYHVAREVSKKKPIILWKGGMTEEGAKAAVSHTGAMAGSRRIWEGVLKQAGIISVRSFEEVLDCLYAFHLQPLPRGKRVGIISAPGGMAVAATDACLELGLEVPQFSSSTAEKLRKMLPLVGGSANNPIDLSLASLVNPRVHGDAISILAEEENIDMLLLIGIVGGESLRQMVFEGMADMKIKKPLVATVMTGTLQSVVTDFPMLLGSGISVYTDGARAVKALSRLWEYSRFRESCKTIEKVIPACKKDMPQTMDEGKDIIEKAVAKGRLSLSEYESKEVLRANAISATREKLAHDKPEFNDALKEIGFPMAIKAGGQNVNHKTEQGLVYLDIRNEQEAVAACAQIKEALKDEAAPVLIQEMVSGKRELVVGLIKDDQFGTCVMYGVGGILTEAFKDNTFRVAPVSKQEALAMVKDIRANAMLGSFRGMPPVDMDKLAHIIVRVGEIGLENPEIKEIDINPLILSEEGPIVVDALIVFDGQRKKH